MKRLWWAAACVALGTVSCKATTGSDVLYGPQTGESIVNIGGSFNSSEIDADGVPSVETSTFTTRAGYGYFFDLAHEIGAQVSYEQFETNLAGLDQNRGDVTLVYNYNLRQSSRTWYYFGVDLGFRWLDDEDGTDISSFLYGLHVGLRQWITPTVSIFAEPFVRQSDYELTVDADATDTQYGILWGIEFAFGRGSSAPAVDEP